MHLKVRAGRRSGKGNGPMTDSERLTAIERRAVATNASLVAAFRRLEGPDGLELPDCVWLVSARP